MARPLRLSFENAVYHVTARGNRRENIFYSEVGLVSIEEIYHF
jgi:putative transposase